MNITTPVERSHNTNNQFPTKYFLTLAEEKEKSTKGSFLKLNFEGSESQEENHLWVGQKGIKFQL